MTVRFRSQFPFGLPLADSGSLTFGLTFLLLFLFPACKPKEVQVLLEPSQALGSVLAEEAVRLAGTKKQVALITPDASWGPPSTVEEALKSALKKHGVTVLTAKAAELGNPMFSGEIGLKAKDFLRGAGKIGWGRCGHFAGWRAAAQAGGCRATELGASAGAGCRNRHVRQ